MYIETLKGDLLAVSSIEIVKKPEPHLPPLLISQIHESHQKIGTDNRIITINVRTASGGDVEVYKTKSMTEANLCFELIREYVTNQKPPFYQFNTTSCLYLVNLEKYISDLLEALDETLIREYEGKLVKWGTLLRDSFEKSIGKEDLQYFSVHSGVWLFAVVEMLVMSQDLYGNYTFTEKGIKVQSIESATEGE